MSHQLRRLDTKLGNDPYGHNTLHLGEVPASTPCLATALAVTNKDRVCALELSILVETFSRPCRPLRALATRFGAERDWAAVLRNHADFLHVGALSRDMFLLLGARRGHGDRD